jgi:ATP synthase protein I
MGETSEDLTHAGVVRNLAGAMFRGALIPTVATVVLGVVVFTVWHGLEGALGALVGGLVVCASSLATLLLMHKTAALDVAFVMAAALGGFMLKMVVLLGVMVLLRNVPFLNTQSVAFTMIATILVAAAAEARASKRTRSPNVIIDSTPGPA